MAGVLVVDDTKFMRMALVDMLTNLNHQVLGEAENGEEAIQKYRALKPDIVIMDITMPIMNGIKASETILSEFPEAKIIICSAMGQQRMVMEAIEAGAKDFVTKPFDEVRVNEALRRLLA
ncbi:response regulator [Bacillus badius]|uniref:Chemotaxis regulator-transmits chemoreceptor signals to flagelllar motor components CheY n=1 Tax=Bacillus badius TaxID=1455 RepID=A0ABR5B1D4_BACBA|nr:response regulator [Bacillus badius]KIL72585.1 Chemotaxis regulator - transmits chemoreceptor signals to flagelllar motor components CheY [Bacillus badius]KIL80774.1 Chemotaxis regulator - transmits chemoreceptor signals to flagelllar motor components CheY [Bacillus badius]KZO01774.1 two-component system response regulator [Bacillus badius]KZR59427.1 two-component system response regulator [Bacillus badius]MED4715301.1 response regulator [Bacillus badius]